MMGTITRLRQLVQRVKAGCALLTVLPVDYYTALGVANDAVEADIEVAYGETVARVNASARARVMAQICGQSPARLCLAREQLLNPQTRKAYDAHLSIIKVWFSSPPQ